MQEANGRFDICQIVSFDFSGPRAVRIFLVVIYIYWPKNNAKCGQIYKKGMWLTIKLQNLLKKRFFFIKNFLAIYKYKPHKV